MRISLPWRRQTGILLVLAAAMSFAAMGSIAKITYGRGVSVAELLAVRFGIGGLAWTVLVGSRLRHLTWKQPATLWLLVAGSIGAAASSYAEFMAYRYLPVGMVVVLIFVTPIWLALAAWITERKGIGRHGILALASVGIGLAMLTGGVAAGYSLTGISLAILASLGSTVLFLGMQKGARHFGPMVSTAVIVWVAALVALVVAMLGGGLSTILSDPGALGLGALLAVLGTVLGTGLLTTGVSRVGAFDASVVSASEPLFAAGLAWALLGELLQPFQVLGAALIIVGIVIIGMRRAEVRAFESTD